MAPPDSDRPPSTDPLDLAARLRLSTARLARILRQQAGTGLSPSQQSVLFSVDKHGQLTLGRLATIEQVTPPTITRIVARLEEDGLVTREADATDRRVSRVTATAEGRRRLEHGRQRRNAWLAQRLVRLSPEEKSDLAAALPVLEALVIRSDEPDEQVGDPPAPEAIGDEARP
jgi:DNA-binding MarR family transcriptional regulator